MKYKELIYLMQESEQSELLLQIIDDNDEKDVDDNDEKDVDDKKMELIRINKEKEKINKQRVEKINIIVGQIITDINIKLNEKSKEILNDIKYYGINESIKRYIEKYFVPYVDNSEDKLFITINIDNIVTEVEEKLSKKM